MSQKKDKNTGKWYYYGAYVDDLGIKHQYKKRGFNSKSEANKAELEFREKVAAGVEVTKQNNLTFENISHEYLSLIHI